MRNTACAVAMLLLQAPTLADDAKQVYEETMNRYARMICSAPGRTDYTECVPAALERWKGVSNKEQKAALQAQTAAIAKACVNADDDELPRCALDRAIAFGDSYIHPAGPLAVWDVNSARLKAELAVSKAKEVACRRLGWSLGEPRVGMSASHARQCGWGDPISVSRETRAEGTSEFWTYSAGRYLRLFNGKVRAVGE